MHINKVSITRILPRISGRRADIYENIYGVKIRKFFTLNIHSRTTGHQARYSDPCQHKPRCAVRAASGGAPGRALVVVWHLDRRGCGP